MYHIEFRMCVIARGPVAVTHQIFLFNNSVLQCLMMLTGNAKKWDAINYLNKIKFTGLLDWTKSDITLEIREIGWKDFTGPAEVVNA